jgi:hypothetical protein
MPLDINWTFTVVIPQLDLLGAQLMERLQGIIDALSALTTQQAAGSDAIAAQITVVADEIAQANEGTITKEQLDAIEAQLRSAAATAQQQAADIRANSEQIATVIPDPPATP